MNALSLCSLRTRVCVAGWLDAGLEKPSSSSESNSSPRERRDRDSEVTSANDDRLSTIAEEKSARCPSLISTFQFSTLRLKIAIEVRFVYSKPPKYTMDEIIPVRSFAIVSQRLESSRASLSEFQRDGRWRETNGNGGISLS